MQKIQKRMNKIKFSNIQKEPLVRFGSSLQILLKKKLFKYVLIQFKTFGPIINTFYI